MMHVVVPSHTEKDKKYHVRCTDGQWLCNCPDFLMRGKYKGVCKHIRDVQVRLRKEGGGKDEIAQ